MKKEILIGIASIAFIFILGLASLLTTFGTWDGAIPSAKFKLRVLDDQKKPISGARLTIFRKVGFLGLNREISYKFPVEEFREDLQPISNSDGLLEFSHISRGLEIGGWAFAFFWVIPISFGDPVFIVHVQAPDGHKRTLKYYDLYRNCNGRATILKKDNPLTCESEVIL